MSEYADYDYGNIAEKLVIPPNSTIIDIGGGKGILITKLLKRTKHSTAFIVDQGDVRSVVQDYIEKCGLEDRITFIVHDFFSRIPLSADIILLSRVLHDWPDSKAQIIL